MLPDTTITLVILDGVGHTPHVAGNAVHLAYTPVLDDLARRARGTILKAHGTAVGMPSDKDMGNSEVGHNAIGSGQVVDQGAKLVLNAIETGALFRGQTWQDLIAQTQRHQSTLHFIGLLSDGNVHSHIDHLTAMLAKAASDGCSRLRVHALLDGRDVGETSALTYVDQIETTLATLRDQGTDARIASGGGRMLVTMDRYQADWEIVARGWRHHVLGEGRRFTTAREAIETYRSETSGLIDQFLPGFVIADAGSPMGPIADGDGVVFFNFRGDRAIEISQAFEGGADFRKFDRVRVPKVFYCGMMQYDGDLKLPQRFLVQPPEIDHTLTQFLVGHSIRQYAISETQKFGHVTYFWNGNRSGMLDPKTETYVEIPSDKVPFEQRPWMKAAEITDALIGALEEGQYRFLRANYANGDMVGHTGDLQAATIAVSCVDGQLGRLLRAVTRTSGIALITADHGNAEQMYELDKHGQPLTDADGKIRIRTSHSLNPVPFFLFDPHDHVRAKFKTAPAGLSQIAATVVELLGFTAPNRWDPSLLEWS